MVALLKEVTVLAQIPPQNVVLGRFMYRALGMKLKGAMGLVGKLLCSTLRRTNQILSCAQQAQYVIHMTYRRRMCLMCTHIVCLMCADTSMVRNTFTNQKYGQNPF
jgi:hypothetical protein